MRILLFILFTIKPVFLNAQVTITKYYDANWMVSSKDKAAFYADFVKQGENYNCTSYWINTDKVRGKTTYADTLMQSVIGTQVLYFKNGHIEDSSLFENNKVRYSYHYYPNNQLSVYYHVDNNKKGVTDGYDESGKRIRNYVFQKDAEFKGGQKAWMAYLNKNATSDFHVKGDTDVIARVEIEFIVDENGDVFKAKVRKSSGYKNVDNDALHLVRDSPKWNYGIMHNMPMKSLRMQPISYTLTPEKR